MAIFNSYVKLPESNHHQMASFWQLNWSDTKESMDWFKGKKTGNKNYS